MKIGIITHWMAVDNYGGILQSYALQKYLQDLGHDAYIIRFNISTKHGLKNHLASWVKNILCQIQYLVYRNGKFSQRKKWIKLRNFADFRNRNIRLSPKLYKSLKDIQSNYPQADLYITGSDQVWAFDLTNSDNWIFYLDFGKPDTKRISYAASFGGATFPGKDETKFRSLLSRFDKISVREINGIDICKAQGFGATRCIDSTLLLNKAKYEALLGSRKYEFPFAYFYTVNISTPEEIYWNEINNILRSKGIISIVTTGSGYKPANEIFDNAVYDYATVEDWLSNIYYSDIVFTASFHGVIFAFIFQKDFVYLPLKKYSSGNNRIIDFLALVGLHNRMAKSIDDVNTIMQSHIDYKKLNDNNYKKLLFESLAFINDSIKQ